MTEMIKNYFKKYKKGKITIEIQALMPEKFINLLWKNNIQILNIKKKSITSLIMNIELKDYIEIEEIAQRTNTKIKIVNREGISFFLIKLKNRIALVAGILIFIGMLYYLSTFIWSINIETEKNISPYEIRQQLKLLGIKPGINKSNFNVYELEQKLIKENEELMWVKARIEGATLKIKIAERQAISKIIQEDEPCNLVCKKEGQVVRIYTTAGTPVVKIGDVLKKGQLLVKGEQGKEGSIYNVHAKGDIVARTFYEEIKDVSLEEILKERTGKVLDNYYIDVMGKKIYFKNSLNKFANYDKIVENKVFVKKETFYETVEKVNSRTKEEVVEETVKELSAAITVNLNPTVKVVDKIIDSKSIGDNKYRVRVVIIGEENVAYPEKTKE